MVMTAPPFKNANSLSSHYHFVYMKRLYRSRKERMPGGTCGESGSHIDVDPTIIRMAGVVVTLLFLGLGIIVYPIAGIIIPESPEEYMEQTPATA